MIWSTLRFVLDVFGAIALIGLLALGIGQLCGWVTLRASKLDDDDPRKQ